MFVLTRVSISASKKSMKFQRSFCFHCSHECFHMGQLSLQDSITSRESNYFTAFIKGKLKWQHILSTNFQQENNCYSGIRRLYIIDTVCSIFFVCVFNILEGSKIKLILNPVFHLLCEYLRQDSKFVDMDKLQNGYLGIFHTLICFNPTV